MFCAIVFTEAVICIKAGKELFAKTVLVNVVLWIIIQVRGYMTNNWQQVLSWCYCMDLSSMENVFLQFCLRQILLTFNVLTFSIVDCSPLCPRQFLTCILCVYLCAMYAKHFPDHEPIDATPIGSPEKKKPFIGKLSTFILYPVLSLANCKQRTDRNS